LGATLKRRLLEGAGPEHPQAARSVRLEGGTEIGSCQKDPSIPDGQATAGPRPQTAGPEPQSQPAQRQPVQPPALAAGGFRCAGSLVFRLRPGGPLVVERWAWFRSWWHPAGVPPGNACSRTMPNGEPGATPESRLLGRMMLEHPQAAKSVRLEGGTHHMSGSGALGGNRRAVPRFHIPCAPWVARMWSQVTGCGSWAFAGMTADV